MAVRWVCLSIFKDTPPPSSASGCFPDRPSPPLRCGLARDPGRVRTPRRAGGDGTVESTERASVHVVAQEQVDRATRLAEGVEDVVQRLPFHSGPLLETVVTKESECEKP